MLIEVCVSMVIIVIMTLMYLPCTTFQETDSYTFGNHYLETQSHALAERETEVLEENPSIYFNAKGNVNKATTLHIGHQEIIVELGGGRLVYR